MTKNQTEEQKQEQRQKVRHERRTEREMLRVMTKPFAEKVINELEERRKERRKHYPLYTQAYVAEQAGISLSTYKEYVGGGNDCIDLITVKMIADTLRCRLSDIIEKAEH